VVVLNGEDGLDGKSVLSGTSAPSNGVGKDGDFFIVRVSPFYFYFKSGGVWSLLGQLKGVDGNGFLAQKTTTFTKNEILTLFSDPVEILPSLVAGMSYSIIDAVFTMNPGTDVYNTTNGMFKIRYFGNSVAFDANSDILNLSSKNIRIANRLGNVPVPDGGSVYLWHSSVNPTGSGDLGTLSLDIVYRIVL
jgi:hypothetical protein